MINSNIKKYVKSKLNNKPIIVEIGAHYGEDSIDFIRTMDPLHVYCFEPDPRNVYIFKKYIKEDRISLFDYAISDKDSDNIDFYLSYSSKVNPKMFMKYNWISKEDYLKIKINASGASSLIQGHSLLDDGETVKVNTKRLDSWAKDNNIESIDFLWIDVQGAEQNVINGFGKMSNNIKSVWIEFGEDGYDKFMTKKETIKLFHSLNFSLDIKMSSKNNKGNLLFWKNK